MAEALKRRGDWDADRHRGMTRWGHREETGVSKPSREASEETNLWTPWPQTSSLQDCKSEFLSFNPSAPWYFVTAAHAECYAENHLAALTDGLRCPTWRLSSASLNVPGDVSVNWSPRVTLSFYTSKKGVIFGEPCRLHSAGARKPPNTNLRGRAPALAFKDSRRLICILKAQKWPPAGFCLLHKQAFPGCTSCLGAFDLLWHQDNSSCP